MRVTPLICPNPKCGGSLMQEVYASRYVSEPGEEDERPENNRLRGIPNSGTFVYKCISCGRQAWPVVK